MFILYFSWLGKGDPKFGGVLGLDPGLSPKLFMYPMKGSSQAWFMGIWVPWGPVHELDSRIKTWSNILATYPHATSLVVSIFCVSWWVIAYFSSKCSGYIIDVCLFMGIFLGTNIYLSDCHPKWLGDMLHLSKLFDCKKTFPAPSFIMGARISRTNHLSGMTGAQRIC